MERNYGGCIAINRHHENQYKTQQTTKPKWLTLTVDRYHMAMYFQLANCGNEPSDSHTQTGNLLECG